jgi:hypothetical protein
VIGLALSLASSSAALSLAEVRQMTPAAAGDTILRDRQHGPIETFEAPTGGMNAPGSIEGQLVERPVSSGPGCVRRRWTVQFRAAPGADITNATVIGTYSSQEISPRLTETCPTGRYVYLNPGVSVDEGWAALAKLKDSLMQESRVRSRCRDTTSSHLCRGSRAVRAELRMLPPNVVTRVDGDIAVWIGTSNSVATEIRFPSGRPSQIVVTRRLPAPF